MHQGHLIKNTMKNREPLACTTSPIEKNPWQSKKTFCPASNFFAFDAKLERFELTSPRSRSRRRFSAAETSGFWLREAENKGKSEKYRTRQMTRQMSCARTFARVRPVLLSCAPVRPYLYSCLRNAWQLSRSFQARFPTRTTSTTHFVQIEDDPEGYPLGAFCIPAHYADYLEKIIIPLGVVKDR